MKRLIGGATAALLALSLAACASGGGAETASSDAPGPDALASAEGVTEITFWHGLGGVNGEALETLIGQFNTDNADKIHVTSSFQGSYADLLAKYTAGLRDDSTPTVILGGDTASGYLHDVDRSISPEAMAEANPDDLDLDDIRAVGASYYSADGTMIAVPLNMSTPALWVNKDLLASAGIDPATPMTTLDEIADVATQFTQKTGKPGFVQPFDGWWFEQLTAASGSDYCTPDNGRGSDGQADALSLTAPAQKAAFATVADLYTSGAGLDIGVDGQAATTAFTAGQVPLMFNSSGAAAGIISGSTFALDALPYPISGPADESGPVIGGSAMWLSNTAADAEKVAGWKLESFLASAPAQEQFSQATGYVPVNTAVDDSDTQKAYLADHPLAQLFVDQLNAIPDVPATAGCLSGAMTGIRSAVVPHMQAAFSGSVPLDEALTQAETDANTAIAQYLEQLGG
jgi:sn-glycerol 3-phosphate transport system substrate-binding protein